MMASEELAATPSEEWVMEARRPIGSTLVFSVDVVGETIAVGARGLARLEVISRGDPLADTVPLLEDAFDATVPCIVRLFRGHRGALVARRNGLIRHYVHPSIAHDGATGSEWSLLNSISVRERIADVVIAPDERSFAIPKDDGFTAVYLVETMQCVHLLPALASNKMMMNSVFSPDGRFLIGLAYGGELGVWDTRTYGPIVARLAVPTPESHFCQCDIDPSSRLLAVGGRHVRLWNIPDASLGQAWTLGPNRVIILPVMCNMVLFVGSDQLAVAHELAYSLTIYDVHNGTCVFKYQFDMKVIPVHFDAGADQLFAGLDNGWIYRFRRKELAAL